MRFVLRSSWRERAHRSPILRLSPTRGGPPTCKASGDGDLGDAHNGAFAGICEPGGDLFGQMEQMDGDEGGAPLAAPSGDLQPAAPVGANAASDSALAEAMVGGAGHADDNPEVIGAPPQPPNVPPGGRPLADGAPVMVVTRYGRITFYPHDSRFEAVCRFHQPDPEAPVRLKLCRLTRSALPNPRKKAQGRPLGLIMAWLEDDARRPETRDDHCTPLFVNVTYDRQCRRMHRHQLRSLNNGEALLACERALGEGEDSEPEGMP